MPVMDSNLLDFVVDRLNAAPAGTPRQVAQATGLAYDSVLRIKRRDITNPRFETLNLIAGYFREQERIAAEARAA